MSNQDWQQQEPGTTPRRDSSRASATTKTGNRLETGAASRDQDTCAHPDTHNDHDNEDDHNRERQRLSLISAKNYQTSAGQRPSDDLLGDNGPEQTSAEQPLWGSSFITKNMSSIRFGLACFVAELVGTFMLVYMGDGAIATYSVTRREADVFAVCLAFGVGAMIATYIGSRISGAHINPAATLAFALDGRLKWSLVPVYMLAQYLGGFLAAAMLYLNSLEAINALDGGSRVSFGQPNATATIFATYPGDWTSAWGAMYDQVLGTAMLLFSLCALCDPKNLGLEARYQPIGVAAIIGFTCLAFVPNCGANFNPARDLAPRLLTWMVGYRKPSVWEPLDRLYWLIPGVLAPHMGAVLGVFGYKFLIGRALVCKDEYELEQMGSPEGKQARRGLELSRKEQQASSYL